MKKIVMILLLLVALPTMAAPCNKSAALDVQSTIHEFAQWRAEGDHLAVYWTYKIESKSGVEQLKMLTTFANMDACLVGGAREIHFYRKGKVMGIASPESGIKLIK